MVVFLVVDLAVVADQAVEPLLEATLVLVVEKALLVVLVVAAQASDLVGSLRTELAFAQVLELAPPSMMRVA